MPYYLAIDAGGTKATYVLADETRVLARVQSSTIKRMRTSAEVAAQNLATAIEELTTLSGVDLRGVTATCVGTAGNTVPLVTNFLRTELSTRVGGELLLLGDVEIALDAAFPGKSGILILAGTGSNLAGRARDGHFFSAGGYGPVLADQGSGHRIGSEALRALFLNLDEGGKSRLLPAILDHWKLASIDDLVAHANTCENSSFSALTPLVLRSAEAGDELAKKVLIREGEDLAYLALLLHRRLKAHDGADWKPQFAFAGSILQYVQPLRDALLYALGKEIPQFHAEEGVVDPALGALWRARQLKSRSA